ncbi:MAG: secondary thiamine-phosphate synthase enzyme YjbQ [Thermodesulfovibrionales bacterium]|nr:secondary thiamine-phosphate synthase enzyme YjbQ [Thermodesulfovibrionales bacterium]
MLRYINVRSSQRSEFIDITEKINEVIKETGILSGICYVYVPHTTAAVTINEGADPSVHRDIQNALARLVPQEMNYSHREGNADAHIKSSIIGTSQLVIIDEGRLVLGTWQAVYFCEFDGPRHRRVTLKLIADK